MANTLNNQIIIDGPRNAVVKVTGVLDTSDLALTTIVLPANFSPVPPKFRLYHVDYSITDQIELQLQWQGTPNQVMMPLAGRGRMSFVDFGGLTDNAASPTGAIQLLTTGWASGIQVFTLVLELVKEGIVGVGVR
jgi:hypothetical protein